MPEGTRLRLIDQRGAWLRVETEGGLIGWAHSGWIRRAAQSVAGDCDTLWYRRNAIFARNGYCFQGARGRAAFGNAGCRIGVSAADIPLSGTEKAEVNRLLTQERALGCR